MPGLLVWEFVVPGSNREFEEQLRLDDDGSVWRVVPSPGQTDRPEAGWWTGTVAPDVLAAAVALVAPPWTFDEARSSPPAAGAWYASGAAGRIGLWTGTEPGAGDALRGQLSAIRSACADAATTAACALRLRAEWTTLGDQQHPTLYLAATGREQAAVWITDAPGVGPAAFMNDDFKVVGYTQTELWVPAGTEVYGVLRDRQPGPHGLVVEGRLRNEAGEQLDVVATVAVAEPEPWEPDEEDAPDASGEPEGSPPT